MGPQEIERPSGADDRENDRPRIAMMEHDALYKVKRLGRGRIRPQHRIRYQNWSCAHKTLLAYLFSSYLNGEKNAVIAVTESQCLARARSLVYLQTCAPRRGILAAPAGARIAGRLPRKGPPQVRQHPTADIPGGRGDGLGVAPRPSFFGVVAAASGSRLFCGGRISFASPAAPRSGQAGSGFLSAGIGPDRRSVGGERLDGRALHRSPSRLRRRSGLVWPRRTFRVAVNGAHTHGRGEAGGMAAGSGVAGAHYRTARRGS